MKPFLVSRRPEFDSFDLGVIRALFCGFLLMREPAFELSRLCDLDLAFWQPTSYYAWLFPIPPSCQSIASVEIFWRVCLGFACLGIFTRLATILSAALALYLLPLMHSWGVSQYGPGTYCLAMIVLAISNSGQSFSVDSIFRNRNSIVGREFSMPVRFIQFQLAWLYFDAGLHKLRFGLPEWFDGSILAFQLRSNPIDFLPRSSDSYQVVANSWLIAHPELHALFSSTVVLIELSAILLLLPYRIAWFFWLLLAALQFGIHAFVFIKFYILVPFFLAFISFSTIKQKIRGSAGCESATASN
jgi:hypothetical protein